MRTRRAQPSSGCCPGWVAGLLAAALLAAPAASLLAQGRQPREPDVITRPPPPGNWQLEQLAVPERSAPGEATSIAPIAVPVPAPAAVPLPPRPRPRRRGPQAAIRVQQLAPDSRPELRVRIPQPAAQTDICEQIRAGTRRPLEGLDCSAAPLQEPPAPAPPPPVLGPEGRPVQAPGIAVPGRERGIELVTPR